MEDSTLVDKMKAFGESFSMFLPPPLSPSYLYRIEVRVRVNKEDPENEKVSVIDKLIAKHYEGEKQKTRMYLLWLVFEVLS